MKNPLIGILISFMFMASLPAAAACSDQDKSCNPAFKPCCAGLICVPNEKGRNSESHDGTCR